MPMRLPLQNRLPNPPVLHGREQECEALVATLREHPLALLTGPDGMGKTSLALAVVRQFEPPGVFVESSSLPADEILLDVARILTPLVGREDLLTEAADSPDAAAAIALDCAEELGVLVLLDGVEMNETLQAQLLQLRYYARSSKWLVTARATPKSRELRSLSHPIGPLSETSLVAMAVDSRLARDRAHARDVAQTSQGSPRELFRLLTGGTPTEGPLDGLTAEAVDLLGVLACVAGFVDLAHLRAIRPISAEALRLLETRGLVLRNGVHVMAHASVGGNLKPDRIWLELLAKRLVLSTESGDVLGGLRVLVALGDDDTAAEVASDRLTSLLQAGYGGALFSLLSSTTSPKMRAARLACAARLGNATALASARGSTTEVTPRVDFAEAAWARGDLDAALARVDNPVTERERRIAARVHLERGEPQQAKSCLMGVDAPCLHALIDASTGHDIGEPTLGTEYADTADLAEAYLLVGEAARAAETLDRFPPAPDLLHGRRALLTRASLAIRSFELPMAKELLDELAPRCRPPSILLADWAAVSADFMLVSGLHESIPAHLDTALLDTPKNAVRSQGKLRHRQLAYRDRFALGDEGDEGRSARESELRLSAMVLASGDFDEANVRVARLARDAARDGDTRTICEASVLGLDVDLARAVVDDEKLAGLAALSSDSEWLKAHVAFARAHGEQDLQPLIALATSLGAAPRVHRRARVILGADLKLDALDLRVLEGCAAIWGSLLVVPGDPSALAWGYDSRREFVFGLGPSGIPTPRRSLNARILRCLAARGGSASKEELILHAWEEPSYHPARHDGRLHVGIRKFRMLLGEAFEARLRTTDDGYSLQGPFVFRDE